MKSSINEFFFESSTIPIKLNDNVDIEDIFYNRGRNTVTVYLTNDEQFNLVDNGKVNKLYYALLPGIKQKLIYFFEQAGKIQRLTTTEITEKELLPLVKNLDYGEIAWKLDGYLDITPTLCEVLWDSFQQNQ